MSSQNKCVVLSADFVRSGILETLLDINQSAAIPPELRFDVRIPAQRSRPNIVPADIDPDGADHLMREYTQAVAHGRIPPLDLHIMREQIDERLAAQGVTPLETLEQQTPHPLIPIESDLPEECKGDSPPGYLTTDQETAYLLRLDEKFGDRLALDKIEHAPPEPHPAELTPRELERHMELLNPQSQHNWLKMNTKIHMEGAPPLLPDDTESLASHDGAGQKAKSKGKGKNLAKQAAERATGYMSPSAASGFEEDELALEELQGSGSGGKKRIRDPDGAYRVKGGKGGAAKGGKRKRTTEEGGGVVKKAKVGEGVGEV